MFLSSKLSYHNLKDSRPVKRLQVPCTLYRVVLLFFFPGHFEWLEKLLALKGRSGRSLSCLLEIHAEFVLNSPSEPHKKSTKNPKCKGQTDSLRSTLSGNRAKMKLRNCGGVTDWFGWLTAGPRKHITFPRRRR